MFSSMAAVFFTESALAVPRALIMGLAHPSTMPPPSELKSYTLIRCPTNCMISALPVFLAYRTISVMIRLAMPSEFLNTTLG